MDTFEATLNILIAGKREVEYDRSMGGWNFEALKSEYKSMPVSLCHHSIKIALNYKTTAYTIRLCVRFFQHAISISAVHPLYTSLFFSLLCHVFLYTRQIYKVHPCQVPVRLSI